ncbi:MAG: beta-lactamase family protein [Acidobacteria bacterium]|nr:beta-lactamase family protein [Acidobacteriota bacterium]
MVALCLAAAAGVGLWSYITSTAVPLHPIAQDVPSVTRGGPAAWADAAVQGRQIARAAVSAGNLPGVSVAVGVGDDIVWAEGFGWADLERRTPVTPETRFRIGTASTALTSAAVGLLLERGRLDLEAPIQTYVPVYPRKSQPVTLGQLMANVAGVGNDNGAEGPFYERHCERPLDAVPVFAEDDLRFVPGTEYRGSSYGWILVSAAVEAAAGEPFLRVMRKQIFEPLGMDDTTADTAAGSHGERAVPYFPRFAADTTYGPEAMRAIDLSCYAGAAVFVSTPSDLVRFGLAMQRGALVRPETVARLQGPVSLSSGQPTGFGLGWDLGTAILAGTETRMVGRRGTVLGGRVASLTTYPDLRLVVAVTSNTSYADTTALARDVAGAFAASAARAVAAAR